jgi:hypothetical protein
MDSAGFFRQIVNLFQKVICSKCFGKIITEFLSRIRAGTGQISPPDTAWESIKGAI